MILRHRGRQNTDIKFLFWMWCLLCVCNNSDTLVECNEEKKIADLSMGESRAGATVFSCQFLNRQEKDNKKKKIIITLAGTITILNSHKTSASTLLV